MIAVLILVLLLAGALGLGALGELGLVAGALAVVLIVFALVASSRARR
jgi:hypothetical protein